MLIKDLVEFGLSEKEAKTYISLLELEVATAGDIAKKSGLNRSSTYVVLESLKKQGLVSISGDKNIVHYIATSPQMLLKTAEDMATKQEEIRKKIDKILPELSALHKDTKIKPRVKIYEGVQGFINAFNDTLKSKEKLIRVFSSLTERARLLPPEYFPLYIQNRRIAGVHMHGIHPDEEVGRRLLKINSDGFDTQLLIPKDKYKFPADIGIYDNTVTYMSAEKGGFAIIIESKEMADVMKNIFDMAFEEAKRLNVPKKKRSS
jgi:sugar-specific transcriptional regulator TrmB